MQLFVSMIAFCVIGFQMSLVSVMLITKQMIMLISIFFIFVALRPDVGHGLLILEVSRSHTTTHHSR
jgi:hypothetical protein